MKKMIAVLLAAVMMLAVSVSAFAKLSPTDLVIEVVEVDPATIEEKPVVYHCPAQPELFPETEIWALVAKLNDPQSEATMADLIALLSDPAEDLGDYDFVSLFGDIELETAEGFIFNPGEPVKATLKLDSMKNVDDLASCKVLVVNPESGESAILDIPEDTYDAEAGSFTVTFPFLGAFVVIQK